MQTTATAAGGMSNVFVSAFPALYQLGLMRTPSEDFWRITTLTAVGGYFGFFFATPCMFCRSNVYDNWRILIMSSAQIIHHLCGEGAQTHFPLKLCHGNDYSKHAPSRRWGFLGCSPQGEGFSQGILIFSDSSRRVSICYWHSMGTY